MRRCIKGIKDRDRAEIRRRITSGWDIHCWLVVIMSFADAFFVSQIMTYAIQHLLNYSQPVATVDRDVQTVDVWSSDAVDYFK